MPFIYMQEWSSDNFSIVCRIYGDSVGVGDDEQFTNFITYTVYTHPRAIVIMCLPADRHKPIKYVAAVSTLLSLLLSLWTMINYNLTIGGMQFVERIPWIADLGVNYALGVDGISLPLLLLTNLIGFSAVYASWHTAVRVKEFFALLLILITGVMGTFITTDLFIFFLFYKW